MKRTFVFVAFAVGCQTMYADPIVRSRLVGPVVDAGPTPHQEPCPASARVGESCSHAGMICEFGASTDPKCNALFACRQVAADDARWEEQQAPAECPVCPSPDAIVDGAPCTVPGDGGITDETEFQCATADAVCGCTTGPDGAHAHPRRWVCRKADVLCPTMRPLAGQPCAGRLACDYGSCDFKRGSEMVCDGDVWQSEFAPCD